MVDKVLSASVTQLRQRYGRVLTQIGFWERDHDGLHDGQKMFWMNLEPGRILAWRRVTEGQNGERRKLNLVDLRKRTAECAFDALVRPSSLTEQDQSSITEP